MKANKSGKIGWEIDSKQIVNFFTQFLVHKHFMLNNDDSCVLQSFRVFGFVFNTND
jgi:hypothetical protein